MNNLFTLRSFISRKIPFIRSKGAPLTSWNFAQCFARLRAGGMTKSLSSGILIPFLFAFSPLFADLLIAGGYIFKKPLNNPKWETYTNNRYGFSIQYPTGPEIRLHKPYKNVYAELEINLPTVAGSNMLCLYLFTDATVKSWNKGFPDGEEEDGEPFPYKMKTLYNALELSDGATTKDLPGSKIVIFHGSKAIYFQGKYEDDYFIHRTGNRWIELRKFNYGYVPGKGSTFLPLNKEQKASLRALVKTMKLFDEKE